MAGSKGCERGMVQQECRRTGAGIRPVIIWPCQHRCFSRCCAGGTVTVEVAHLIVRHIGGVVQVHFLLAAAEGVVHLLLEAVDL